MNKAIFLDRDGVVNQVNIVDGKPYPPKDMSELILLPKVNEALQLLKDAGYLLIVITNQPDVVRGKAKIETVETINQFLKNSLPIDDIFTCYHDDIEDCNCRKPKPGHILKAADQYNINISRSFMIGDRWRDIEAGISAGCITFFIDYSYQEKQPKSYNFKVKSLYEAAKIILEIY
ncbi:HAD family hydrolase [Candidatus Methylopumilus universalis]|uniref:D-glycero-alpha-D-manno-heptose-1,7-bisphosphate 7-phosphatase n=1 Tax=Candidatus Methylopumilus universalis TaxID=2588536 RepID=UPI00111E6BBB|nr:HAD family hydrolase [Candidatus Methylopumilus universalis]QDC46215.1 HAD family hydrolase [Candidatus Methylopumilus universalis]